MEEILRKIMCLILGHRVLKKKNRIPNFFKQFPKFYCYRCGEYVDYFKSRSLLLFFRIAFSYIKGLFYKICRSEINV